MVLIIMSEPPTKVRRMCAVPDEEIKRNTVFKQLAAIKNYPLMVAEWFMCASPENCKLAGSYGVHLLVSAQQYDLALQVLDLNGITCENMACGVPPENATTELAILMVQALTEMSHNNPELLTYVYKIVACFTQEPYNARKRIVELLLQCLFLKTDWLSAGEVIRTYLCGQPFMVEVQDLVPLLIAPAHIRLEILSWFTGQEIYFPADTPDTVPPAASLVRIPMDLEQIKQTIYGRLLLKPPGSSVLPSNVTPQCNVKFVIDAANVLYSGGVGLLNKIIAELSLTGTVAVVIHKRHVIGKSNLLKSGEISKIELGGSAFMVETPYGVNDDYYSIWMAMEHNACLVTNDQFHDHVYHISPLIKTWRNQTNIRFNTVSGMLYYPLPFSHCIQCIAGDVWLPTTNPERWICVPLDA